MNRIQRAGMIMGGLLFCLLTGCHQQPQPLTGAVLIPKETTGATTSTVTGETDVSVPAATDPEELRIILNTDSKRFHITADCSAVKQMSSQNYAERAGDQLEIVMQEGYTACGICAKEYKK